MTIINIAMTDRRVVWCTDTIGALPDGTFREVSKFFYLPLCNTVIANRGTSLLGRLAYDYVNVRQLMYDEIAARFLEVLRQATKSVADASATDKWIAPPESQNQEVMAFGWSQQHKAFRGIAGKMLAATGDWELHPIVDNLIGPFEASWGELPAKNILDMAHWQMRNLRQMSPEVANAHGGRLMIGELLPDRMMVRDFGPL